MHADELTTSAALVQRLVAEQYPQWSCTGVGDPACDLIPAWNLLPPHDRDAVRAGVDDDTWARGRGWALTIALVQLPYYRTSNPALAENSRVTIDAILHEPD